MILTAMLALVWLLVGPTLSDRPKAMTQREKKKGYTGFPRWRLGVGLLPHPIQTCSVEKLLKKRRRASKESDGRRRRKRR